MYHFIHEIYRCIKIQAHAYIGDIIHVFSIEHTKDEDYAKTGMTADISLESF